MTSITRDELRIEASLLEQKARDGQYLSRSTEQFRSIFLAIAMKRFKGQSLSTFHRSRTKAVHQLPRSSKSEAPGTYFRIFSHHMMDLQIVCEISDLRNTRTKMKEG
jgi:hypothetical protein